MSYNLDPNAAKAADVIFSKVEQRGKYLGMITRAEPVTSKKGTTGIDLSFKSDSGETADYLTLWTNNADGKTLMGYNTLMAIMTCLRIKTINSEDGEIEKYDEVQKKRVKVFTPLFKELMNKPLGLLIFMEEYPKNAGGTGWKPVISAVFDKDEFTASEILSKAIKPELLTKMVLALKDKPLKAGSPVLPSQTQSENPGEGMPHSFSGFDDDLPFAHHGKCGAGVSWRDM